MFYGDAADSRVAGAPSSDWQFYRGLVVVGSGSAATLQPESASP